MSFAFILPWMIATYAHFFLHTRFFNRRQYYIYILLIIPLVIICGFLSELSVDKIMYESEYERSGYFDIIIVIAFTTGLRYFRRGVNQQYRLQEMEAKQLKAELSLLKSQVNPHFLFNTLNNLFSIAQKNDDEETAQGLIKLSQLMRYMIYESNAEFVSLEKEINYIEDYIELQKIRVNSQEFPKIKLDITGTYKAIFISPMILIPFIENAFKYGMSAEDQNLIDIFLGIEGGILKLRVKNTISNFTNESDNMNSGIGLNNVKRRLELIYPARHILSIQSDRTLFEVDLRIEI